MTWLAFFVCAPQNIWWNTMVGVTARLVSVAVKDHDLDDHVTEGE